MLSAACTGNNGKDHQRSNIQVGDGLADELPLKEIWKPDEQNGRVPFYHYICEPKNPDPQPANYIQFREGPLSASRGRSFLRPVNSGGSLAQDKPDEHSGDSAVSVKYVVPFWPGGRILLAHGLGEVKVDPGSGWHSEKVSLQDARLTRKMPFKAFAIEGAMAGGVTAATIGVTAKSKMAAPVGSGAGAFGLTFAIEYILQKRRDRIFLNRVSQWLKGSRKDEYQVLICDRTGEESLKIGLEALGSPAVIRTLGYTPHKSEAFGFELKTSRP